jgi:zinc transporter 1/2/3
MGITQEPQFTPMLIALVFHQFFEGLALSTVVMDTDFNKKIASIVMVTFYSLTTPVGIALGIGIYKSFDQNSIAALLTTGFLNAFSSGILLYDGLINIVNNHYKSKKFMTSSSKSQYLQVASMWIGVFLMALVGKWA